jgi:acetolactate synthase I/II/III large subunit
VEAVRNRTPLLLLTGSPTPRIRHLQELDIAAAVGFTGAGYARVRSAATASSDTLGAIRTALVEQRPVVLDAPYDLLGQEASDGEDAAAARRLGPMLALWLAERPSGVLGRPGTAHPESLDEAVGMMASARRCVILAGAGAVRAGARTELIELADRLGGLLATTLRAKDYFGSHPYNVGIMGSLATSVATEVLADADCIVAFGASLNPFTTYGGAFVEGKRVIQCDIDATAIGRSADIDVALQGDAAEVAAAMSAMVAELDLPPSRLRDEPLMQRLAEDVRAADLDVFSSDVAEDPRAILLALNDLLPPSRTVVFDAGFVCVTGWPYLDVQDPRRYQVAVTFGCIGLGLGTAIGAAFAHPAEPTVLVVGDGAWAMSFAELATAVRHRLPLIVLVCDNNGYGAEYIKLAALGEDPDLAQIEWTDTQAVAAAMGARTAQVRSVADLEMLVGELRDMSGPLVVHVPVDPAYLQHAMG